MPKTRPEITRDQVEINAGGNVLQVTRSGFGRRVDTIGVGVFLKGTNYGGRNEFIRLEQTHPETFQALNNLAEAMKRDNVRRGEPQVT